MGNYWLFQFPFEVHCGWIIAASVLNVNLLIVERGYDVSVQTCVGIVSLAVLLTIASLVLYFPSRPNDTIPVVLSWASGCIFAELNNPKSSILDMFGNTITRAMKYASLSVCVLILILLVVRFLLLILAKYVSWLACFGNKKEQEQELGTY